MKHVVQNWGDFGKHHAALLKMKLMSFAGTRTGLVVPGSRSGLPVVNFTYCGEKFYIAQNASYESVRFVAHNLEKHNGVGQGINEGPIFGLNVPELPPHYCIYAPKHRKKRT